MIDAGHKSRSSKIKGTRRIAARNQPPTAAKNWGEVAMIISGLLRKKPKENP